MQAPVEGSSWGSNTLIPAAEYAALRAERDDLKRQLNVLTSRSEHGAPVESIEDAEQAGYEKGYDVGFEKGLAAGREAVQEEVEEVCSCLVSGAVSVLQP